MLREFFTRIIDGSLRNSHKLAITQKSAIGYNPVMVQREVIGVGNAPQYWLDGQMIGFNAISGGGTIAGNPPASAIGAPILDWQAHTFGGPTQTGTLTQSREYVGLAPQPNFNIEDRR
jgi:hypothetical protein